jgi:putative transport protein
LGSVKVLFFILTLGYILGSIKFLNIKLGTSGVLLVALVFGHFGQELSVSIRDLGLVCFVASVGLIAGPVFFCNFKSRAAAYIVIGIVTIIAGAALCVASIKLLGIPVPLAVGIMNGALTSTPGLAAAIEATGDPSASIGYGIAYPFGVLGVVLFVQIVPRILRIDFSQTKPVMDCGQDLQPEGTAGKGSMKIDPFGFFPLVLTIAAGLIAAKIVIPLPGGARFSLGASGGPLLTGLLIGYFGHIGPISLEVRKSTLETMREFGLALFLAGAGAAAGKGFVATLTEHGPVLFFAGVGMTLLPMMAGYFIAVKMFGLDIFNTLGSICGGMTSTPALGVLISETRTDYVSLPYAATYPVALILVVLASQFIAILC